MNKKIKSITLYKQDMIQPEKTIDESEIKGYKYSYAEMDERGNIVLDIHYSPEGETEEKYVTKCNDRGQIIEEISFLQDNEIAEHKIFENDPEGKLIRIIKHYTDGSKDITEYTYDDEGNPCLKITTNDDNETETREIMEWLGKLLTRHQIYEYDDLVAEESNFYDDKGNRVETLKWTSDEGNVRLKFNFNENNDVIKSLTYNNEDKLISKTIYHYDESGKLIKVDYESVKNKNTTTILYDNRGNAIEQKEVNGNGEINNLALRTYNERNELIQTYVSIDFHGARLNQEYKLTYEYEYFE